MTFTPRVVDTSHHNTVNDLSATQQAGVWGVIHKATQGTGYRDPDYASRRKLANAAGLLWGAYHFNDGSDMTRQVDFFLATAKPDDDTLLVFDYEDNPKSQCSPQNMVKFLRLVEQRTGRKATIYSGNRLKETIHLLSAADRAYVCQHKLWLCQYGPRAVLPPGFSSYFLWQFTDGKYGPQPHRVAGISGTGIDLNVFDGTQDELIALWTTSDAAVDAVADGDASDATSSHADDAAVDAASDAEDDASTDNNNPAMDPAMPVRKAPPVQPNIQHQRARYDVATEVTQRELVAMGYHEVGDIDGKWGGKTAAAIKAFFVDRGVTQPNGLPAIARLGPELNDEIGHAKEEGFTRPISHARATATALDIAPKVEGVRITLWQRFAAKIAAGATALGIGGSSVSSIYASAHDTLSPVNEAMKQIPPVAWMILLGIIAGAVWYATNRVASAATKDYNTGRLS